MENEDQTLKDALDTDPDLLDFDLDENSLRETALEDSHKDEIIELVDVIKKGKYDPDRFGDTREFRHLFDEDVTAAQKPSEMAESKIKWAEEFEADETEFTPSLSQSATLEIKETDLIYDEEDHSADDIIDIDESDLMTASGSEGFADLDEDIPEIHAEDLETGLSSIPEVPLDDLMEVSPEKSEEEEAISEKDLEEVLEGASTDEISLDFQEESPKPDPSITPYTSTEDELNLEEELEKALEEPDVEEEGMKNIAEQEDLEESLQKLFEDEDDEEPLVKTIQSKPKPARILKEEKVKPKISGTAKYELSKSDIEALIAKEVRVAVEKVTRETMSHVAEKFIVEAISSLKKSIDSSAD